MKLPRSRVYHLQSDSLDHRPFLLVLTPLDLPSKKKPFRFEEMWLSHPSCEETVQVAWYSTFGSDLSKEILAKVEKYGSDLSWWNRDVFGSVRQELNRKKNLLVLAENQAIINGNNHKVQELKFEINVLLDREARMWAQRSRLL